MKAVLRRFSRL